MAVSFSPRWSAQAREISARRKIKLDERKRTIQSMQPRLPRVDLYIGDRIRGPMIALYVVSGFGRMHGVSGEEHVRVRPITAI